MHVLVYEPWQHLIETNYAILFGQQVTARCLPFSPESGISDAIHSTV